MIRAISCTICCSLALAACEDAKPELAFEKQQKEDVSDCREAEGGASQTIAACTRLLHSAGDLMAPAAAYNHRARAFEELGEWDHAKVDYRQALKRDPNNERAKDGLATLEDVPAK